MFIGPPSAKFASPAFDVVVIAASAGGVQALLPLVRNLPGDFPIPIVLAQHLPPSARYRSQLPEVLQCRTTLRVKWAEDREAPVAGTMYVAPQDRNTVFEPGTGFLRLSHGGRGGEGARPAADPLFLSAAQVFGSRAVGVVVSGMLCDGAEGAAAIAQAGGRVLAQTASEAQFVDMPMAAMKRSGVGFAFESATLASVLVSLVMMPGAAAWFEIGKQGVGADLLEVRLPDVTAYPQPVEAPDAPLFPDLARTVWRGSER